MDNLLIDLSIGIRTRSSLHNFCVFFAFVSRTEPNSHLDALNDSNWVNAMQDELDQFERNQVWAFTSRSGHLVIRTKWFFRNKLDETGNVIRNKVRLVPKGYNEEEGIDFEKLLPLLHN